ncbi:pentatricopeptide repeat-containing protein At4g19220, mitochondrial-like [Zingiber officinale]|uniref:Pentatricopeptide repeat-containing protein n=1 Tax=Zingiber officinale TaxID=94328 RepID=A0A8J5L514_ZINOF|nr:pentatricopeptide repeat-containing protein At4g19220, mitochondrial-like [Zingiber officinale]KAG6506015.1 hypothetical protein ZIOFF_031330 [Zingiber officinale]
MVMRALGRFAHGRNLPSTIPTSPLLLQSSRILKPSPISNVSNAILFYSHHLFDAMTEPTILSFRTLSLLKNNSFEPDHVNTVHCLSLKTNTLSDLSARTSLLTAYAGAQDLDSAVALFDETVTRDVILWNAIISAFVLNCHFRSSILLFQEMVEKFGEFDSTTLLIVLSAFSRTRNLKYATTLHGTIIKKRFCVDVNLCNALIDMYAKCDDISSSELVFKEMEVKDVASWNCMINGCTHNELPKRSLYYFRKMRFLNVEEDSVSLLSVIAACSLLEELSVVGESVHGLAIKMGYQTVVSISNCLISLYFAHGHIEAAAMVFKGIINKNVVSWNSMVSGLLDNGQLNEAFIHFLEMQSKFMIQPDDTSLVAIIPACGNSNLLYEGKSIHAFAFRRGIEPLSSSVENSLLGMYMECGDVKSANNLFKWMPTKDIISWNTMISQLCQNSSLKEEAQMLFRELLRSELRCNTISLIAIIPSCNCPEDLYFGKALHTCLIRYGFSHSVSAVNALMLMYINSGYLHASAILLDGILGRSDVVSWNTLIVGYVQNGSYKDALRYFAFMHSFFPVKPDSITFVSALSACGHLALLFYGQSLHGLALKSLVDSDVSVKNALLTMYFRCNDSKSAEALFKVEGDRNVCTWNCMISGFVQNIEGGKSLKLFRSMEGVPNEFTIVSILCACTQLGDLRHGKEVHGYVFRFFLEENTFILSALVDMYSKCGRLDIASLVFESSKERSVASWNSMIAAYGMHGEGRKSIELFTSMCKSAVKTTKSTFVALLSACRHCGLVNEGLKYFNDMSQKHGIEPNVEHCVHVIDMLGRTGRLTDAQELIEKLPFKEEPGVWGALLSACRDHGNLNIGKTAAQKLFCSEPENTGYYVTLSNLFANREMWNEAVKTRGLILERGLLKPPGCSVVDVLSG